MGEKAKKDDRKARKSKCKAREKEDKANEEIDFDSLAVEVSMSEGEFFADCEPGPGLF